MKSGYVATGVFIAVRVDVANQNDIPIRQQLRRSAVDHREEITMALSDVPPGAGF